MAGDQTTGTPVSCQVVQAGAKPDLRDDLGATPLDVAAAEGDEAMVKLLMPADSPSLTGDLIAKAAKAPRSAGTAAEAPSEAEKVGLCLVALPQPCVRAPIPTLACTLTHLQIPRGSLGSLHLTQAKVKNHSNDKSWRSFSCHPAGMLQASIPDPETPDDAAAEQHKRAGDEAFVRQAFSGVRAL